MTLPRASSRPEEPRRHKIENDGTQIENDGARIENDGSQIENDGLQLENNGIRIENDGVRIENDGSLVETDGNHIETDGTQIPIVGFQIPARLNWDPKAPGLALEGMRHELLFVNSLRATLPDPVVIFERPGAA